MSSSNSPSSKLVWSTHQGLTSSTWSAPDLSGESRLAEMFEAHATNSASHEWAVWEDQTSPTDDMRGRVVYSEWWMAIHRAGRLLQSAFKLHPSPTRSEDRLTICIFGTMDPLTYIVLIQAIMYLGHVPFPLSHRNSATAVARLLQVVDCSYVIIAGGDSVLQVAEAACREVEQASKSGRTVHVLPGPAFLDVFPAHGPSKKDASDFQLLTKPRRPDLEEVALILHSSGRNLPHSHVFTSLNGYSPAWNSLVCRHNRLPQTHQHHRARRYLVHAKPLVRRRGYLRDRYVKSNIL